MSAANPNRTQVIDELVILTKTGEDEIIYGVFNDPEIWGPRFDSGEIHPSLREEILDTPMWSTPSAPAAKRYMLWTNEQREHYGKLAENGAAILRTRTLTPWRDVTGQELEEIDEGRRANG